MAIKRHGIHLGVGQAGDQVEGPGARSRHHHAGLAAGAGISLGREDAPLLVARQNGANPVAIARQRLVQGHAGAARIGKDDLDAVPRQRLDQNVCPGDRLRRGFGQGLAIIDGGHGESSLPGRWSSQARLSGLPGTLDSTTSCHVLNNRTGRRIGPRLHAGSLNRHVERSPGSRSFPSRKEFDAPRSRFERATVT